MSANNKDNGSTRRKFLAAFFAVKPDEAIADDELVKMLTADGKLVTVSKSALAKAATHQKSTNKEILAWMNNPSKDVNP